MPYRTQSGDTTRAAEEVQFGRYREMTAAEKILLVQALCRQANALALAGLRHRWPDETDDELKTRLAALRRG